MVTSSSWPLVNYVLDDFTIPWRQGDTEVILLHPGLGGNSRLFRSWVPILGDEFRILRIDPRWLNKPERYEWSLDGFIDDVIAVLDALDVRSIHWVGASGGGVIGQHAAITRPQRIRTLSLIATTPRFKGPVDQGYDAWLSPLDQGDHAAFIRRDRKRRFGSVDQACSDWIISELTRTPGTVSAELHRWVRGVDLVPRLHEIACPTIVITGEQDVLTDLQDAQLLATSIPNAQLEILPGLPHNIAYTHPHTVAKIVKEFVLKHVNEQ